jgi:hypothetical protein
MCYPRGYTWCGGVALDLIFYLHLNCCIIVCGYGLDYGCTCTLVSVNLTYLPCKLSLLSVAQHPICKPYLDVSSVGTS